MKVKKWQTYLGGFDRLDWEVHRDGSRIRFFSINYRAMLDSESDGWTEVARFDTCHGFLHIHRFWLPERERTADVGERRIPASDFRAAFAAAALDLERNWQDYRRRMNL